MEQFLLWLIAILVSHQIITIYTYIHLRAEDKGKPPRRSTGFLADLKEFLLFSPFIFDALYSVSLGLVDSFREKRLCRILADRDDEIVRLKATIEVDKEQLQQQSTQIQHLKCMYDNSELRYSNLKKSISEDAFSEREANLAAREKAVSKQEEQLVVEQSKLADQQQFLDELNTYLATHTAEFDSMSNYLKQRSAVLSNRSIKLTSREKGIQQEARTVLISNIQHSALTISYLQKTPAFHTLCNPTNLTPEQYTHSLCGLYDTMSVLPPFSLSANVKGPDGTYHTSLSSCTCAYFQRFHAPCDHMLRLALEAGGAFCFAPSAKGENELSVVTYRPFNNVCWYPVKDITEPPLAVKKYDDLWRFSLAANEEDTPID